MAISFGGLATGLDTSSIISALMQAESKQLTRLQTEKSYLNNRLSAFETFESKLNSLKSSLEAMDTETEVRSYSATNSTDDYFLTSSSSSASPGTYGVEVVDLAQVEKQVSQGYADKSSSTFGTGTLNLTVDGELTEITIDSANNSLSGIAEAINDADAGVTATVINDGTGTPYRLILTGDAVQDGANGATSAITLDASGLTGGTDANPGMSVAQYAQQAHIVVDTIDIYSKTNTISEAIPGVTLDLTEESAGKTVQVTVAEDKSGIKAKVDAFIKAYNEMVTFIADQQDADWGSDSSLRTTSRGVQNYLTTTVGSGNLNTLSQLGIKTERDGTLTLDSTMFNDAVEEDLDGVVELFSGNGTDDGIATTIVGYLEQLTDSEEGIYAAKKDVTDSAIRRLDRNIDRTEARLDKRQASLEQQFTALETLISSLNAQGDYLTQQLKSLPSIGGD